MDQMIRITRSDKNLHKSDTNRKELRESRSCVQHTLSTVVDIKFSLTNQSRSKSNKVGDDGKVEELIPGLNFRA